MMDAPPSLTTHDPAVEIEDDPKGWLSMAAAPCRVVHVTHLLLTPKMEL
jgi:hypothetical protein